MTFTITVTGTYTRDEIPPRCRKPRPVTYDATATATVETVSAEDAPVAFRVTSHFPEKRVSEIRTHAGKLYTPYLPAHRQQDPTIPGDSQFPAEIDEHHYLSGYRLGTATSAEEFATNVSERFTQFLIIDGTVWSETAEPGYHVATYGLGGINGSTGLSVSTRTDHGTLFRADEFEAALAHAIETSKGRGDDPSRYEEENGEHYRDIDVLIPEAVTLVTMPPTPRNVQTMRWAYDTARRELERASNPDEETRAFREACRLREAIIQTGHTPVESDARPYEARHGQLGG